MEFKRAIRNRIGYTLAEALILLGYVRRARQKAFQEDVILAIAFHNPDAILFKRIVAWFRRNGFVFISSTTLVDILHRRVACPIGAVWISLDDGWRGNMDNVIPVVAQYDIPVTIFVCTDAVEEGTFWWRKVQRFLHLVPVKSCHVNTIKKLPEDERKKIISLIDQNGSTHLREAMNVEEIKRIARMPQVTMGAHTAAHPILPRCSESQLEYELVESKRKLEEWTGKEVIAFAYPGGSFDGRERKFLEACGYELAATTESKFGNAYGDTYLFPRNIVMDDGSFAENLCHALGIWDPLIRKIKQLLRIT